MHWQLLRIPLPRVCHGFHRTPRHARVQGRLAAMLPSRAEHAAVMARAKGRRRVCGVRGHESKAHETVQHRERGVNRRLVRSRRGSSHSANYEGEIRTRNQRTAFHVASPMMRPMPNAVFIFFAPYWGTPTWAPTQRSSQGGGRPLLLRKKGRSGLVVWWGRFVGFRCSSCLPPLLLVLLFFNGNLFSFLHNAQIFLPHQPLHTPQPNARKVAPGEKELLL